ncbi:MAG: glycosyltransferase family 2 protein [Gaiellaceae bacterium]
MISIVIPTKNGGERFGQLLASIREQEIDEPVEIVVVDSGSSDGTDALAERSGALLKRIPSDEFSHGGARNLGATAASGEVLVFVSQDAVPENERWLASLVAPLGEDDSIAAVYGRQRPFEDVAPPERYFLDFLYGPRARTQRANGSADLSMDTTLFSNANSAIRRSIWEETRFSEDILMAEDQDWSVRVLRAGYALRYEPEASVRHSHAYSIRSAFRRFFDSGATADRTYLAGASHARRTLHRNALRYARGEVAWLWRTRQQAWIPYTVVYELSKYLGLALGRRHRRLPRRLKQRLSTRPAYWSATQQRAKNDGE